ncbi:MAG TPA: flavin reductase family protein [Atribacteraceae bacterium]|nr:flavin reductase family protein [Atribacteraceae bacterium]
MVKKKVPWLSVVSESLQTIDEVGGLLLVSRLDEGMPNIMTIGWVQMGITWGRPVCTVLVRPSRFTFGIIEQSGAFTVSVPTRNQKEAVRIAGTVSGKNLDKFSQTGLTPVYHSDFSVPGITECSIDINCVVVQKTRVDPAHFKPSIIAEYYPENDYHTVYFGHIQSVRRTGE